jgi:hypothetical protein
VRLRAHICINASKAVCTHSARLILQKFNTSNVMVFYIIVNTGLTGNQFAFTEKIHQKAPADLTALQTCFQQGQGFWSECVRVKGQCFKGLLGQVYKYPFLLQIRSAFREVFDSPTYNR